MLITQQLIEFAIQIITISQFHIEVLEDLLLVPSLKPFVEILHHSWILDSHDQLGTCKGYPCFFRRKGQWEGPALGVWR